MNDQEIRSLEMLKRVGNFDKTHGSVFPPGTLARELFDFIAAKVLELEAHAVAESSGRATARGGTKRKAVVRAEILEDLSILRRTARSMAFVIPGVADKFRLPRNMTDQELLDTARAFLADAEPLKAEFLRREVPEQLFEDLRENIAAFETALSGQFTGKGESVTAGASIDKVIEDAINAVRQLDPIVRNKFHDKPGVLAAWQFSRHTERAPRRSRNNRPDKPAAPETPGA